jgi:hypothetical protein
VVSLVRGRCGKEKVGWAFRLRGAQKEVTSGPTWVITFLWVKFQKFLINETFVIIGKIAARGL